MKRKLIAGIVGMALATTPMTSAFSQQKGASGYKLSDGVVKIGVLTDLSGAYSDLSGSGAVLAVKMAIDDFKAMEKGKAFPIELVSADHQNKGDVASNKAREWFERDRVDMITDLVTTSTALAVMPIAK
jgi:branched-chain amino acid transport system substrate-binding protein